MKMVQSLILFYHYVIIIYNSQLLIKLFSGIIDIYEKRNNMEIRHLIWFKKLAETENMTRAAEELFISQPHLSKCINDMESELGVKLFDRIGRGIVLNKFGREYYSDVIKMFDLYNGSNKKLRDMAGLQRTQVSLSTNIVAYIPGIVKHTLTAHKDLTVHQHMEKEDTLVRELLRDETDFVVSCPLLPVHPDIESQLIRTEDGVVIYPEGHKFENCAEISSREIVREPMISAASGYGLRNAVDIQRERLGLEFSCLIETSDPHAVFDYVNEGLGVAITSRSMAQHIYGSSNRFKKIREKPTGLIGISWRRGRHLSDAARLMLDETFAYFNELNLNEETADQNEPPKWTRKSLAL